jgi:hypothetical protein
MKFLYALINLPVRLLIIVLAYRLHRASKTLPEWMGKTLNREGGLLERHTPKIEAYDALGRRVGAPKRFSL